VYRDLIEEIDEQSEFSTKKIVEMWREESLDQLQGNAKKLREYATEVEESDDGESYEWRIEHPTARQYEMGGTIFHTYDDAKSVGWTRDQFYETLEDCQEIIPRQRYAMKGAMKVKREVEK